MNLILKLYNKIFSFIENKELNPRIIHTHLITVLTTSVLMWSYAIIAHLYISDPLPGRIGFICSFIALFSPVLFKFTTRHLLITSLLLGLGILHQSTFSYFTGGFKSTIIIWFGILPLLAGLISGKKAVILWTVIVVGISGGFLTLELLGHSFPYLIDKTGILVSHILIVFGWIFITSITLYAFSTLSEEYEKKLTDQKDKIDYLLKVLLHDISNSVTVLKGSISLLITSKITPDEKIKRYEKIEKHSDLIGDTLNSIKAVYQKDGDMIPLTKVPLIESLEATISNLEDKILQKKLKINIQGQNSKDISILASSKILENQVFQNILTNAIKFSFENNEIDIQISQRDNIIDISFIDYGVGIPKKNLDILLNSSKKLSSKGTNNEEGTGFGVKILKNYVEKMHGNLNIESLENNGTTVTVSFLKIT